MRDVREEVIKHIVTGRIGVAVNYATLGIDPCGARARSWSSSTASATVQKSKFAARSTTRYEFP